MTRTQFHTASISGTPAPAPGSRGGGMRANPTVQNSHYRGKPVQPLGHLGQPWLPRLRGSMTNSRGFTLIECLVAIIMVALLASAIAPALVLAVATRVQSQRAEQALQLAQGEIDRVRSLAERGNLTLVNSTATVTFLPKAPDSLKDTEVATQAGPAYGAPVARNQLDSPTKTFQKTLNGQDFAIQIYRTKGYDRADGTPAAFAMGVRVYDGNVVAASGKTGNLSNVPLSLGLTGGEGKRSERPLAALYTTIAVSEQGNSLCDLIQFTKSTSGVTASTPLGCNP